MKYDADMGFMKEKKTNKISEDAQLAWNRGDIVFTPVLNFPTFNMGFSGGVEDVAAMTQGILAVGWKLDTWAAVTDANGKPQIMPLFVRPGADIR